MKIRGERQKTARMKVEQDQRKRQKEKDKVQDIQRKTDEKDRNQNIQEKKDKRIGSGKPKIKKCMFDLENTKQQRKEGRK